MGSCVAILRQVQSRREQPSCHSFIHQGGQLNHTVHILTAREKNHCWEHSILSLDWNLSTWWMYDQARVITALTKTATTNLPPRTHSTRPMERHALDPWKCKGISGGMDWGMLYSDREINVLVFLRTLLLGGYMEMFCWMDFVFGRSKKKDRTGRQSLSHTKFTPRTEQCLRVWNRQSQAHTNNSLGNTNPIPIYQRTNDLPRNNDVPLSQDEPTTSNSISGPELV